MWPQAECTTTLKDSEGKQWALEILCLYFTFCSPNWKWRSREENISFLLSLVLSVPFHLEGLETFLCPPVHKVPQTMPDLAFAICPLQAHSPDHTALVSLIPLHIEVTVICNGKDMRWKLSNPLVTVESDLIHRVEGQQLVWIHCYKDWSCVSLENSWEDYCYSKPANKNTAKGTRSKNLNRGRREAWEIIALGEAESPVPHYQLLLNIPG